MSDNSTLCLAPARDDDAQAYWQINNHPAVRAVSFSTDDIPWSTHQDWFANALANPHRHLYVTTLGGQVVAVSRMDIVDNEAEISVAVDPEHHGQGIGLWTVLETGKYFFRTFTEVRNVRAMVKPHNLGSRRLFEKAGYTLFSEDTHQGEPVLKYRYQIERGDLA